MKKMNDGVVVVGREDLATGNENCPAKDVAFNMLRDDRMLHEADTVVFREKKTEVVLKAPAAAAEGGTTNEEPPEGGTPNEKEK